MSLIDMSTNVYTTLFTEDEFQADENGSLKISQSIFLKDIDKDQLNDKQKEVLDQVIQRLAHHFSENMTTTARRLSVSVKRGRIEEEKVEEERKTKQKTESTKTVS